MVIVTVERSPIEIGDLNFKEAIHTLTRCLCKLFSLFVNIKRCCLEIDMETSRNIKPNL